MSGEFGCYDQPTDGTLRQLPGSLVPRLGGRFCEAISCMGTLTSLSRKVAQKSGTNVRGGSTATAPLADNGRERRSG